MPELDALLARAGRLASTADRMSVAFARELARVARDLDRQLAKLIVHAREGSETAAIQAGQAVVLKAQIRQALERSGYDSLIATASGQSVEAMVTASIGEQASKVAGLAGTLEPKLDALRRLSAVDLLSQGEETATALWRSLAQWMMTSRPSQDILDDLADALDGEMAQVRTLFDTYVSVYGRQVEASATDDLGGSQPFLYLGPVDALTREWCLSRVGRVYTRDEIDQMDNGQLPNTFLTGGGYNCRHSWMAVEGQELRAMVGTSERIPEQREQIARIQAQRRKKAG